jgi:hypothetical protein
MKQSPGHRDTALADAQKAADIDDAGHWLAGVVHYDVDEWADIFTLGIDHAAAEDDARFGVGERPRHNRWRLLLRPCAEVRTKQELGEQHQSSLGPWNMQQPFSAAA